MASTKEMNSQNNNLLFSLKTDGMIIDLVDKTELDCIELVV
jgi:hypothetical protein